MMTNLKNPRSRQNHMNQLKNLKNPMEINSDYPTVIVLDNLNVKVMNDPRRNLTI